MREVGFVWVFFFPSHMVTTVTELSCFFCVCKCVYMSGSVLAHEPEQCGLSRVSFSLSHNPSIRRWPWCLWGGRAWPTSTTFTATRTRARSWQIQRPDFLLCLPPSLLNQNTRFGQEMIFCNVSGGTEKWNSGLCDSSPRHKSRLRVRGQYWHAGGLATSMLRV